MGWTAWVLASAFFLALYDLCKKASVRGNAVLPVLLVSSACGWAAFGTALALAGRLGDVVPDAISLRLAALKALIVSVSWMFTFTALRTLPVTVATPIRASSPALVCLAAFFLYGECPSVRQGSGMALVFAGYWAFSWAGRAEGIDFLRSRAVWCAVAGAALSAVSALFDKYVFQLADVRTETVQFYFQAGLVLAYAVALLGSRLLPGSGSGPRFAWRGSIPFVGILLAAADWLYFTALDAPGTPISAASLLRRLSVVLTFVVGAALFRETNLRRKALALALVLAGVALLCAA